MHAFILKFRITFTACDIRHLEFSSDFTSPTQRAQTSLAEADHYSHIAHYKNVEPWW